MAKGQGAVKRRSAAACGVRATNPASVATQCKQGRIEGRDCTGTEKGAEQGAKTRQSGGKGSNAGTVFACH